MVPMAWNTPRFSLHPGGYKLPAGSPIQTPRSCYATSSTCSVRVVPAPVKHGCSHILSLPPSGVSSPANYGAYSAYSASTAFPTPASSSSSSMWSQPSKAKVGRPFDMPRASVRARCAAWEDAKPRAQRAQNQKTEGSAEGLSRPRSRPATPKPGKVEASAVKVPKEAVNFRIPVKARKDPRRSLSSLRGSESQSSSRNGSKELLWSLSASSLLSSAGCQTPLPRVLEERDGDAADDQEGSLSSVIRQMEDSIQGLFRRRPSAAKPQSFVRPPQESESRKSSEVASGGRWPGLWEIYADWCMHFRLTSRLSTASLANVWRLPSRPSPGTGHGEGRREMRWWHVAAMLARSMELTSRHVALQASNGGGLGKAMGQRSARQSPPRCQGGHLRMEVLRPAEAFAHDAEGFVGQLLVAEWLVLLRYFTACGFVHEAFSAAAAAWLGQGTGQLQMAQLQELVAVLARSGHLQGEAVVNALKHLPTEPEEEVMLRLAACLAAADAGERDFYRSVISKVAVPKTEEGSDLRGWPSVLDGPDSSDFWRLALLLLLAKAEVVVWPKVLSLLRRMDPQVASSVPSAQLPRLLRHLHLAALENDVILLEGRPVAKELMKAVHVDEWTPEELAGAASALGYLAVVDVNVAEAIRRKLAQSTAETTPESQRHLVQAAWASCVARSLQPHWEPGLPELREIGSPPPANRQMQQQIRQVALSVAAAANGILPAQCDEAAKETAYAWLAAGPGRAFLTPHRCSDQVRISKAFASRLRELGVYCREEPRWKAMVAGLGHTWEEAPRRPKMAAQGRGRKSSQTPLKRPATASRAARDTFVVVYTPPAKLGGEKQKKAFRVTLWAKHPLLVQGPRPDALNGFEALEWSLVESAKGSADRLEHILLLVRSDSTPEGAAAAAEKFAGEYLGITEVQPKKAQAGGCYCQLSQLSQLKQKLETMSSQESQASEESRASTPAIPHDMPSRWHSAILVEEPKREEERA
ncbi:unnamed protein product [Effrenium voratum]|uniref:Uncharacterized protein n=1 Tax=Effrenium voratum TaxID=2562239 RepID=A0AA36MNF5_9DINO|nr:unnamed protein product [Effrenium voratum]